MSKSEFVSDIKRLARRQWKTLRHLRLTALRDSPDVFLASYDRERRYKRAQWRAEFDQSFWHICQDGRRPVGLIGAKPEPPVPNDECYLEYIWVSPGHRRSSVASDLVASVLGVLRKERYRIAYLWVLDGNEPAMGLYKKLGFVSTNDRNPVEGRPGRYEERMMLELR